MRNRSDLLFIVLACTLLWTACFNSTRLRRHPGGEVALDAHLEFEFSRDIIAADDVGKWKLQNYFKFEPHVEGAYQWKTRRLLEFVPQQRLPNAQKFVATPTMAIPKMDSNALDPIEFHTPWLKATGVEMTWREESYSAYHSAPVSAVLVFNYEVTPDSVLKYLEMRQDGKVVSGLQQMNWGPTERLELAFDVGAFPQKAMQFEFVIKKGLTPTYGTTPLEKDIIINKSFAPISELEIQEMERGGSESNPYYTFTANQPIDLASFKARLHTFPVMTYRLDYHGNRIDLYADFEPGSVFTVQVDSGVKGLAGGNLNAPFRQMHTIPYLEPFVRFEDPGRYYLARNGQENIRVKSVGVQRFVLRLYEVYANNLVHFLNQNYSVFEEPYQSDEKEYYYGYNYSTEIDDFGRILRIDTLVVTDSNAINRMQTTLVHLQDQLRSKYKGIFVMEAAKENDYWGSDSKVIALSDIGIVARQTEEEIVVFTNSIRTARPLPGVEVQIVSRTNQTMFTARTGADGSLRFPKVNSMGEGFVPRLIVTQLGNDYNFLDLRKTEVETYRFDLGGKSHRELDAYPWSDRNLYRPGDTLHVGCIVRHWDFGSPKDLPLLLSLRDPQGKVVETQKHIASKDGALEAHFPFALDAFTGEYTLDISTASDGYLASLSFHVEDFMPDKIRVAPRALAPAYQLGDTAAVLVEAEYYFGAACDSHYYETRTAFQPGAFDSRTYKDYTFALPQQMDITRFETQGHLSRKGQDTTLIPLLATWDLSGPVYATTYATVHDNSGRTVTRKTQFIAHTQPDYLGMRVQSGGYLTMGDQMKVDFVAATPADKAAPNTPIAVTVSRQIWRNVLRGTFDGYRFESEDIGETVYADTFAVRGGAQTLSLRLKDPGVYVLKAGRPGETPVLRTEVLVYGKGAEHNSSFGAEREGTIRITTDKPAYKTGETARVHFATPFAGRLLVTAERDKVQRHWYLDVPKNSAELRVPITEADVPNVVLSATLFYPMLGSTVMPFSVSHGYTSLKVDHPAHNIQVKIESPERASPGKRAFVTLRTRPNAYVTLAAVDEGILAIRRFKTPDPYPYLYEARELRVKAFDMYRYLLPEVARPGPATGGDATGGYAGLNPFQIRRIRPVAFWSGILRANASGIVKVPLDFPQGFNGKVRLMAVAWSGRACGSGESSIKVHEDLVVNAALPRFLIAGDTLQVPVHALNTTEAALKGEILVEVQGPVRLLSPPNLTILTEAKASARNSFRILAGPGIGKASIRLRTTVGKASSQTEHVFAVYPNGQLEKQGNHGSLAAGQAVTLTFPGSYYPETQMVRVRASNFPAMELGGHLRDLVTYPHGCVEQTVSSLFPQLYFGDLAAAVAPEAFEKDNAVMHIRTGIKKLERMMTYDGGFSFWEGGEPNDWVTCYAMHFLVEAQKAGYPVAADRMQSGLDYLGKHVTGTAKANYVYYRGDAKTVVKITPKEWLYALYVLALAGKPDRAMMNAYKAEADSLAGDSRFLLAGSFALAGDIKSFRSLLPKIWTPEVAERGTGGILDSDTRPTAMALCALVQADPAHPFIPEMVAHIARNAPQLLSTQDKAWAFLGLGKAARALPAQQMKLEVIQGGQVLASGDGSGLRLDDRKLPGQAVSLRASGKGKAYYFWEVEGVPLKKPSLPDEGMKLRRTYFDAEGQEIVHPVFRQGELIVCRIQLTADRVIENVVVTDLLPAGMEVENQRIGNDFYDWIKGTPMNPANQDIKDRGLATYLDLAPNQTQTMHYLLRPVNPGRYQLPPAQAEAMYVPSLRAQAAGGFVQILPAEAQLPVRTRALPGKGQEAGAARENRLLQIWRGRVLEARKR
jgi:alpha-2-macroglobulin